MNGYNFLLSFMDCLLLTQFLTCFLSFPLPSDKNPFPSVVLSWSLPIKGALVQGRKKLCQLVILWRWLHIHRRFSECTWEPPTSLLHNERISGFFADLLENYNNFSLRFWELPTFCSKWDLQCLLRCLFSCCSWTFAPPVLLKFIWTLIPRLYFLLFKSSQWFCFLEWIQINTMPTAFLLCYHSYNDRLIILP